MIVQDDMIFSDLYGGFPATLNATLSHSLRHGESIPFCWMEKPSHQKSIRCSMTASFTLRTQKMQRTLLQAGIRSADHIHLKTSSAASRPIPHQHPSTSPQTVFF